MIITQIRIQYHQWLTSRQKHRALNETDITVFLRQFATLISAGISLVHCCDVLEKSQEKLALQLLIYNIKREILAGKNLSQSFIIYPHYFDNLIQQLIMIGEQSGRLDEMLLTIAHHQEKKIAFKKRIQQALFYPMIISLTALLVTIAMLLLVIPRFAELFRNTQVTLPFLTSLIFYLSALMQKYFFWLIAIISCSLLLLFYYHPQKNWQRTLLTFLTTLPIIKSYRHKIFLARFARHLALTLSAGMPITEAFILITPTSSATFTNLIANLRAKISAGVTLHHAMRLSNFFPFLMIQMVKIGEESGQLETMLNKSAEFLESEMDAFLIKLSELLEPLIMIVLGVLIGGLVIGMYLPIFKLGNTL